MEVVANVLHRQSQPADKGWSSIFDVGRRTDSSVECFALTKLLQKPRIWKVCFGLGDLDSETGNGSRWC